MHFVIIEPDWQDTAFVIPELQKAFLNLSVTIFKNVGDFLMGSDHFTGTVDLIITEEFLPLMEPREDSEEFFEKLQTTFPTFFSEKSRRWDHHEGAYRVVKFLKERSDHIPVLIHANIDKEDSKAVREFSLPYCIKDSDCRELIEAVRIILRIEGTAREIALNIPPFTKGK